MFYAVKEGWFRGVFLSAKVARMAVYGFPGGGDQQTFRSQLFAHEYVYGGYRYYGPAAIPVVYTDGSYRYKTKRAGYGVFFGVADPRNGSGYLPAVRNSLNAEGVAAAIALLSTKGPLEIRTDCIHMILLVTIFKTALNALFRFIRSLARHRHIIWTYTPAHSGVVGNEAADSLARWGSQSPCEKSTWWRLAKPAMCAAEIVVSLDLKTYLEALIYGSCFFQQNSRSMEEEDDDSNSGRSTRHSRRNS